MNFFQKIFCLFLCYLPVVCYTGKVLFIGPMISPSHKLAMVIWADALADRGHDIYWWAPAATLDKYQPKKTPNVEHFTVEVDDDFLNSAFVYHNHSLVPFMWWENDWCLPFSETFLSYKLLPFCENIIKNHRESLDRVLSRKYDLLIIDELFSPCGYLVAQQLGIPVATYVSTCRQTRMSMKHNGMHVPHSYLPFMGSLSMLPQRMTYFQRAHSAAGWALGHLGDAVLFRLMTRHISRLFPNVKPIETGLTRPDFQFICVHKELEYTMPLARNVIHIGGLQLPKQLPPLNAEFESIIESAKRGFILIAMGHWADWNYAPPNLKAAFIAALSKISNDYVIIWQYGGPPIDNLPSHIKLVKWTPQQSLLAHPKCKVFITHAGCNSLTESVYYGVPMVAIPLSADQPDGASKVTEKGFGLYISKTNVTVDGLYGSIMEILKNDRYLKNVKKVSELIRNDPETPLERAIFWTEYAMKHGGPKNLFKSSPMAANGSWLKYYCLDIFAFLVVGINFLLWVIVKTLKFLWKFMVGDRALKSKSQ